MRRFTVVLVTVICGCSRENARQPRQETSPRRILYYHDPMHPSYRSDRPGIAPDCNMALTPVYADEVQNAPSIVRVDTRQAEAIGLRTEAAREEEGGGEIRTVGRVEAQESRKYQLTAGADGWIRKVYGGETGTFVRKGQPLGSYYSRDLTTPQQAYLYALDSLRRVQNAPNATAEQKDLASKQVTQARDYLESLGLVDNQIRELEKVRQEGREVTLGAPASGVVLERTVSEGARLSKGDVLWEVADIESIWITADLFNEDLASVTGTRKATVILPDNSERDATVDSAVPRFQGTERVGKLRLTMSNPTHQLLPGMTVTVRLRKAASRGLTVAADAVVDSGLKPRVFVHRPDGSYEARAVQTGWRSGGRTQILNGLQSGEQVVVAAAFLLDSESRMNEVIR